jgi:hypothetical protein
MRDEWAGLDMDRVRASFSPEGRKAAYDAWKASLWEDQSALWLSQHGIPAPPENMKAPVYEIEKASGKVWHIYDPGGPGTCGGWTWDPPCGGCDGCLLMQAKHYDTNDKWDFLSYEEAVEKYG